MSDKIGTLQDVAALLKIQPDTAWRWARSGYLPTIALGRDTGRGRRRHTLRFDMEAVQKWAARQSHPGRMERVPYVDTEGRR